MRLRPAVPWIRLAPVMTLVPNFADGETPTGAVDGSNPTFTLLNSPNPAASLKLYVNGLVQQAGGGDFTLVSKTITFVTPPPSSSIILAWYRY